MAEEIKPLSNIEKQIVVFSFYRDAEIRGARLLFNLLGHLKDQDSQLKMTRHLADETAHAWLWTKRISDLGGKVLDVPDGYQRRLGMRAGVPKTLVDLLALTVVVEARAQKRYLAHMETPGIDQETLDVLKAVTKDEVWHLSWIEKKMMEIARNEGDEEKATVALERYREIDRQVWASLAESEEELMRGTWVIAAS
jgi:tRNA isopentenyl-2-thiomethyl-A-37 hydroxylase MiaE